MAEVADMASTKRVKLTEAMAKRIEPPVSGQAFHRDSEVGGFALRVTAAGTKSYVIEKLINRKVRRITIGRADILALEEARKRARKLLGLIADGRDPAAERRFDEAKRTTLKQAFERYLTARRNLRPRSVDAYRGAIERSLADWLNRPVTTLTPEMILERHTWRGSRGRCHLVGTTVDR